MRRLSAAVVSIVAVAGSCFITAPTAVAAPAPTCTTTRALFRNPFHNLAPYSDTSRDAYTSLEVNQHGVWAGFAYDGVGDFMPISWRPGHKPRVLEYRRYRTISYSLYRNFTISMVGVTPSGAVIGDVQATHSHSHRAFAYLRGHRYRLRTLRTWTDVRVLAVTDTGRIIGYGEIGPNGRGGEQVVSWANVNAAPRTLVRITGDASPPAADQAGDVVWSGPWNETLRGSQFHLRLPSGQIRTLVSPYPDYQLPARWVAAGHYVFTQVNHQDIRWDTRSTAGAGPLNGVAVTPRSYDDEVQAAGVSGALVWGGLTSRTKVSLRGRGPVVVRHEYDAVSEAVGPYNHVAFTSARDHLVHVLACH